MKIAAFISASFLVCPNVSSALADPTSDLKSPNQANRDKAAAVLRHTYVATPPSHFEKLPLQIHAGMSKHDVATILASYHAAFEESVGGLTSSETYRIDPTWVLEVWSSEGSDMIEGAKLIARTEKVWVQPPKGFTGTWTEYYANGQKMYEERHGDPDGINQIFYYDNGHPWCVSTNTENTYYFRDGRIQPEGHIVGMDN